MIEWRMELRRQAHSVYRCMYHIVWIPRYRYRVLVKGVEEYLQIKMDEVRKQYPELEYIERNIQPDHIHIVVSFPPKYSIAKMVQVIKQNTGRSLRERFEFLKKRYHGRGGIWSAGYFVSTVGLDEETIKNYVRYQEQEDLGQAKLEFSGKKPRT
jgi:putative transposase